MNLGLCIVNLLRRYPAVDVPEIGVFKVTHVAASYDEKQSAYLPPTSYIELIESDAEAFPIITYLQRQRHVDEQTAKRILDKAVAQVMESISRHGQALLTGLGYLFADGASLLFKPFDMEGFGLKPVKEPALVQKQPSVAAATAEPNEQKVVPAPVAETNGAVTEREEATDEVSISGKRRSRWLVAAVLTAVLLSTAVGLAWYFKPAWFERAKLAAIFGQRGSDAAHKEDSDPSDQPTQLHVVTADTSELDTALAAMSADSIVADSVAHPGNGMVAKPSVTYEIIVGSFATMAQANKYVAQMKAKGYDLYAIESRMPGNRKKISWGSFATEEEAYRELARVQKTFEPGAWIAKIEHGEEK
ncbi:Sporulation related domain-containing protein [Parapedobacter luteus]|uniref:Sporulation related domain-containing protein n=1 Tax=Parapedobacter luteus TaxID=623280 RepID=A0A1T5CCG2_9SPHI|nr:Sporulation related domain-containing protein [Parapedobacter luteus]